MIILAICLTVFGIIAILALLVMIYRLWDRESRSHVENTQQKMLVNKWGADVQSGKLGSGSLFTGYGKEQMDTVCISDNLRGSVPHQQKHIRLTDQIDGHTVEAAFTTDVYIGRHIPKNMSTYAIEIKHETISGIHCYIFSNGEEIYIEDKQSTNGTYINGHRITAAHTLHSKDVLRLGSREFLVDLF